MCHSFSNYVMGQVYENFFFSFLFSFCQWLLWKALFFNLKTNGMSADFSFFFFPSFSSLKRLLWFWLRCKNFFGENIGRTQGCLQLNQLTLLQACRHYKGFSYLPSLFSCIHFIFFFNITILFDFNLKRKFNLFLFKFIFDVLN